MSKSGYERISVMEVYGPKSQVIRLEVNLQLQEFYVVLLEFWWSSTYTLFRASVEIIQPLILCMLLTTRTPCNPFVGNHIAECCVVTHPVAIASFRFIWGIIRYACHHSVRYDVVYAPRVQYILICSGILLSHIDNLG